MTWDGLFFFLTFSKNRFLLFFECNFLYLLLFGGWKTDKKKKTVRLRPNDTTFARLRQSRAIQTILLSSPFLCTETAWSFCCYSGYRKWPPLGLCVKIVLLAAITSICNGFFRVEAIEGFILLKMVDVRGGIWGGLVKIVIGDELIVDRNENLPFFLTSTQQRDIEVTGLFEASTLSFLKGSRCL